MILGGAMIYVKDFPVMREFYARLLRAAPRNSEWTEMFAEFACGETTFSLHAVPPEIAEAIAITRPPVPREEVPVKLTFATDDLEGVRDRLRQLGAAVIERPWQADAREFDFVDPEGNIVRVVRREPALRKR
ncbi:MAG: VOC family protein [Bryobacteraceae bacterium]